ncbi:anti-sigma F factor antagonist [Massilibacterium senegalense]|uniref:anti-sigma F factor antagonist n=1 Tax=Massilibacterium senegalense TaxID=1632858 RepID=UPI000784637F|nr:anti-sigma F factor antagonist [Massilibacterium senegalense]
MGLHIDLEKIEETLVVRLIGELDHHTAKMLRERMEQMMSREQITHLVFNLKGLQFMDSSGLGVLLGRYKQVDAIGGKLIVCHVSQEIDKLFEMSGIYKIIPVEKNEEEALKRVGVWV